MAEPNSRLICILIDPCYTIDVGGVDWRFDWNERLGPTIFEPDKEEDVPITLPEEHPFWVSFGRWFVNGKKVDESGRCLLGSDGTKQEMES